MSEVLQPRWIASWTATGLVIGEIVLVVVFGGGDIDWLRYLGFGLWALSAVFGWVPIIQFRRSGGVARGDSYIKTTRVVTTGLYSIVWHPQYVAWPLMAIAAAFVSQHLLVAVMAVAAVSLACVDFRTVDRQDIEKFGDEYRRYVDVVPGWNFLLGLWRWLWRRSSRSARPAGSA